MMCRALVGAGARGVRAPALQPPFADRRGPSTKRADEGRVRPVHGGCSQDALAQEPIAHMLRPPAQRTPQHCQMRLERLCPLNRRH